MDREAWLAAIYGATRSRTQLSDWTDWTESTFISLLPFLEEYKIFFLYTLFLLNDNTFILLLFLQKDYSVK